MNRLMTSVTAVPSRAHQRMYSSLPRGKIQRTHSGSANSTGTKMTRVINSRSYQQLSEGHDNIAGADGAKALEIKRIYAAYLRSAEMSTRQDFPELGNAIIARQVARKQALIP